jgi:hypothetical protein
VRHEGVIDPSALSVAKLMELVRIKVRSIVGDDAARDSEYEDYLSDELNGSGRVQLLYCLGLDPLGELIDYH